MASFAAYVVGLLQFVPFFSFFYNFVERRHSWRLLNVYTYFNLNRDNIDTQVSSAC